MPAEILTRIFVTATELKEAPMKALAKGKGNPVAVVKHNTPLFYVVPADLFAKIHRIVEDHIDAREAEGAVDEPCVDGPRNMQELDAWDVQIERDRRVGRAATDWSVFAASAGLRPATAIGLAEGGIARDPNLTSSAHLAGAGKAKGRAPKRS
jgi:antitoxin StbD